MFWSEMFWKPQKQRWRGSESIITHSLLTIRFPRPQFDKFWRNTASTAEFVQKTSHQKSAKKHPFMRCRNMLREERRFALRLTEGCFRDLHRVQNGKRAYWKYMGHYQEKVAKTSSYMGKFEGRSAWKLKKKLLPKQLDTSMINLSLGGI